MLYGAVCVKGIVKNPSPVDTGLNEKEPGVIEVSGVRFQVSGKRNKKTGT